MSEPNENPHTGMSRQDKIASLAGAITQMHLQALGELAAFGIGWQDVSYAAILALRSLATMGSDNDLALGTKRLERIVGMAMRQEMIAKKFDSEADFREWAEAEGLDTEDGVALVSTAPKDKGPVH
jgi:hypothetical protein